MDLEQHMLQEVARDLENNRYYQSILHIIKELFGSWCPTCRRWYFDRMNKEAIKHGIECIGCDHVRGDVEEQQRRDYEEVVFND